MKCVEKSSKMLLTFIHSMTLKQFYAYTHISSSTKLTKCVNQSRKLKNSSDFPRKLSICPQNHKISTISRVSAYL